MEERARRPRRVTAAAIILILFGMLGLFPLIEGDLVSALYALPFSVPYILVGVFAFTGGRWARVAGIVRAALDVALIHWVGFTEDVQALLAWPFVVPPLIYVIWALWTGPGPGRLWMPAFPPRVWRVAYGVPWVALALLLVVTTVESPPKWFGEVTVGSILASAALVFFPALLPALGFIFVRGRGGLVLIAVLGIMIAVVLFLAVAAMHPSQIVHFLVVIAVVAAVAASIIAILVLFIVSHETPPPSAGGWWEGPFLDADD